MKINKAFILSIGTENDVLINKIHKLQMPYRFDWEIVPGVRGVDTDIKFRPFQGWQLKDSNNKWWNRPILEGEIGCSIGHWMMWKQAYDEGHELCLFLEEDFSPVISLGDLDLSDLPKNTDGFYLSRNKVFENAVEEEIGKNWIKPSYSYNLHAYCLTRSGLEKILKYDFLNNIMTPDEFVPATYCVHPREDMAKIFKPTLNFYAHKKEFIVQKNDYSNIENSKPANEKILNKMHKYEILDASDWDAWKGKYLDPIIQNGEWDLIVDHLGDEVYEFPLFTKKFCDEIIAMTEELDNWTYSRHEFYPTTDVLLQDIGMNEIYDRVINEVIRPMCIHLWILQGKAWKKLNSENFLARYLPDAQSHLSLHHDHSHLSLVVKLNDEFDGGGTYFPKYNLLSNPERVGTATIHPGQITHRHGARPIYSGRRYIIVSFIKNQAPDI
jgi:hypothetical protein